MTIAAVAYVIVVAVMSLVCFIAYGLDKRRATDGGRRVSERTLHLLAAGHASMLLYSMPHLTGVNGEQRLRDLGRAVGAAGGDQALPAVGQPLPRPSGVSWTSGVETTTGPLEAGA